MTMMAPAASWRRVALAVLALLVFVLAFQGSRALYAPDEGRYTAVALEMLRSGDWVHPHLHPEVPHYTKPPLTYWVLAASLDAFGINTWAARLPYALAFVATVLMLWRLGRRFVPAQPWLPALVYASALFPFMAANMVTTDTLLAAAELLTILGFVETWWNEDRSARVRWGVVSAIGAALAFLTKGPPGLLPLAAAVLFVLLTAGRSGLLRLWSLRALLVFVVLSLWWYFKVAMDKPELLHYFLVEEVWHRVASGSLHRNEAWYGGFEIYLPTLLIGTLPWTFWLLGGLHEAWRERRGLWSRLRADHQQLFLLCWLLLPLTVFFLARSRLPLYVLPCFAPLALLAARRVVPLDLQRTRTRLLLGAWLLLLVGARAAPAWMEVDNDESRLASAVAALVPVHVDEAAFVETAPRYGLRFYLNSEVERLNLPNGVPEAESQAVSEELTEHEGCRLLLVETKQLPELEAELRKLTHTWRDLGRVGGYHVLLAADEDDCGESKK
jgi:4-amino-4-deoxy-L-arabinose transferase